MHNSLVPELKKTRCPIFGDARHEWVKWQFYRKVFKNFTRKKSKIRCEL